MESFLENIIESMIDSIDKSEVDCINSNAIDSFKNLTLDYFDKLKDSKSKEEFENYTKIYIYNLNDLHKSCNYQFISADQREMIILMIDILADHYNYYLTSDFTSKYRIW